MCSTCKIKNNTTEGSVVKIVRRCNARTGIDKGEHLAIKQALVYVERIAPRGEGFYGYVIKNGKLGKTLAHFRECEFASTNFKWENIKLT